MIIHERYKLHEGVAYLVLVDKKYPQKLAKCYLDDISEGFMLVTY